MSLLPQTLRFHFQAHLANAALRLALLSAAWLGGVLLGLSVSLDATALCLAAGAFALLAAGLRLAGWPVMLAVPAVVLLLGAARAEFHQQQQDWPEYAGNEVLATGTIASDPETTARQVRFELDVDEVEVGGTPRRVEERWLVYVEPPDELVARRSAPYFRYGDEVRVHGTPVAHDGGDGFDYVAYLSAQGLTATMFGEGAQVTGEGGLWWRKAVFSLRGRFAESIEESMPYPESALAAAMLLGKRETLPPELVEKFRGTGSAHLLAISGLHVGVLLAAVAGAAAWLLGRHRPAYLALAAIAIWTYAVVAGASPSALRAAVMGTVYLLALGLGRPSSVLPALALAAAVMTAASPNLIQQVSFQLSFAAVGGSRWRWRCLVAGWVGVPRPRQGLAGDYWDGLRL